MARAVPLRGELRQVARDVRRAPVVDAATVLDQIAAQCRAGQVAAVGVGELATLADAIRTGGGR